MLEPAGELLQPAGDLLQPVRMVVGDEGNGYGKLLFDFVSGVTFDFSGISFRFAATGVR